MNILNIGIGVGRGDFKCLKVETFEYVLGDLSAKCPAPPSADYIFIRDTLMSRMHKYSALGVLAFLGPHHLFRCTEISWA